METSVVTNSEGVLLEELGWLRTLARRLMADPNDAEDVVQEAWLKTREVVAHFPSRNRLRAWLAGFAYRMARDTVRARRRRERREEVAALSARQDAEDGVERLAALESLLHTVRMLDEPLRAVVLLRYLDGHTTAEIAAGLGISEDLVRKRLTRGRAALRRALGVPEEAGGGRGLALGTLAVLLVALCAAWWARGKPAPEAMREDPLVFGSSLASPVDAPAAVEAFEPPSVPAAEPVSAAPAVAEASPEPDPQPPTETPAPEASGATEASSSSAARPAIGLAPE
jgi:RNA polymerase sigma-70 factor (ECF subfamily)